MHQELAAEPAKHCTSMTVAPKQMRRKSNTSSPMGDAPVVISRTCPVDVQQPIHHRHTFAEQLNHTEPCITLISVGILYAVLAINCCLSHLQKAQIPCANHMHSPFGFLYTTLSSEQRSVAHMLPLFAHLQAGPELSRTPGGPTWGRSGPRKGRHF